MSKRDGIEALQRRAELAEQRVRDLERVQEQLEGQLREVVEKARAQEPTHAELQQRLSEALARANAAPPTHAVRAFERGARAERARVLEQSRVELLSWPLGTPERRALEALRKALQDERLPLPPYTTGDTP